MTDADFRKYADEIMEKVKSDPQLRSRVDPNLRIPDEYGLDSDVKLIVLGQDPTVKNEKSRASIRTVLNLDRNGSLKTYLNEICEALGLELERHVLAINLVKNFFTEPPARWSREVLIRAAEYWRPLLDRELALAPDAPVIILGEPVLQVIAGQEAAKKVREYWGYEKGKPRGESTEFGYLRESQNILNRKVFPMPHVPSRAKTFYRTTMASYLAFIKRSTNRVG